MELEVMEEMPMAVKMVPVHSTILVMEEVVLVAEPVVIRVQMVPAVLVLSSSATKELL
jgi:hypothetical protein